MLEADGPNHLGGCGCGAVRYQVRGAPIFTNHCHCRNCQHQTGSIGAVNAFFEADRVELLSGELDECGTVAGSGGPHIICRCTACGSAVWSAYPRLGRLGLGVRVGTLDDPGAFVPDAVIFTAEAMPWVAYPPDIPSFAQTYNFRSLLPTDRVARMEALMARRQAGEG